MTISYNSGRRIQGLSSDVAQTVTHTEDFVSASDWLETNPSSSTFDVNTTNNRIDWAGIRSTNHSISRDYTSIDNDAFTFRFKLTIDNWVDGNDNYGQLVYIFIGDLPSSSAYNANHTGVGLRMAVGAIGDQDYKNKFQCYYADGENLNDAATAGGTQALTFTQTITATSYYVEFSLLTNTSFRISLYSDSDYSTLVEAQTVTVPAGVADACRYIWMGHGGGSNGSSTLNGEIPANLDFYNGVSSLSSKPTNVQAGSRFEETDTRKMYHYTYDWFLEGTTIPPAPKLSTRGIFGGGLSATNVIDYITIASTGNATDFGDLTVARYGVTALSSGTRGVFGGGNSGSDDDVMDYVTIATPGNATDFGDLTVARTFVAGVSSDTRGVFAGGEDPSAVNVMDYITIASTGNATDFGDLTVARYSPTGVGDGIRGVIGGGFDTGKSNIIDYITIATTGNATDFGDITVARNYLGGLSSNTRGVFGGGHDGALSNVMDYITIATTGNATDFGDLSVTRHSAAGVSSNTRGVFGGGDSGSATNVMDYITIDTTGNATDFGDLTRSNNYLAGTDGY